MYKQSWEQGLEPRTPLLLSIPATLAQASSSPFLAFRIQEKFLGCESKFDMGAALQPTVKHLSPREEWDFRDTSSFCILYSLAYVMHHSVPVVNPICSCPPFSHALSRLPEHLTQGSGFYTKDNAPMSFTGSSLKCTGGLRTSLSL